MNKKTQDHIDMIMERVLKINSALALIQEKNDIELGLAFDMGLFKEEIEIYIKQYNSCLKKLEEKYFIEVAKGVKAPDPEKSDQYEKERDKLLDKKVENIKVFYFKLSQFKKPNTDKKDTKELTIVPPKFFALMGDLIERD